MTTFIVKRDGLRLTVRVLPTIHEVRRAYADGDRKLARMGRNVRAFFAPNASNANGEMVLPLATCTPGLVAHEVKHAVCNELRHLQHGNAFSDEPLLIDSGTEEWACIAVQCLTDRIWARVEKLKRGAA